MRLEQSPECFGVSISTCFCRKTFEFVLRQDGQVARALEQASASEGEGSWHFGGTPRVTLQCRNITEMSVALEQHQVVA